MLGKLHRVLQNRNSILAGLFSRAVYLPLAQQLLAAMLITDHFLYIHYPKTGGTFVTRVLERLYGLDLVNLNKHGACRDVPAEHMGKPLVSTFRHPLDRLVSHYEFRWWAKYPKDDFLIWDAANIKETFPNWPDLTFPQYVSLWNDYWIPAVNPKLAQSSGLEPIGIETYSFLEHYSIDFNSLLRRLREGPSSDNPQPELIVGELHPVRFLRMENLNRDLYLCLKGFGWSSSSLAFLRDAPPVYPMDPRRKSMRDWKKYYSRELLALVSRRERLLLDVYEKGRLCFPPLSQE